MKQNDTTINQLRVKIYFAHVHIHVIDGTPSFNIFNVFCNCLTYFLKCNCMQESEASF